MSRPKSARRVAVSRIEQRAPQERAAAFPLANSEGREFDGISEAAARKTLALLQRKKGAPRRSGGRLCVGWGQGMGAG